MGTTDGTLDRHRTAFDRADAAARLGAIRTTIFGTVDRAVTDIANHGAAARLTSLRRQRGSLFVRARCRLSARRRAWLTRCLHGARRAATADAKPGHEHED